MTFDQVDQILLAKGLATDPAFDNLKVDIDPIRCSDTCPLGLYFPVEEWSPNLQYTVPGGTIVLPPEASEPVLLHELGHRHGHYYYGDLSERYAEDFRKIYEPKGRALLYKGNDFSKLPRFGALFEEGERGAVEMALAYPLTPDELCEVESRLNSCGERCRVCYGDGELPFLRMEFTQGVNWPVIIASSVAGMVVLTAGALGYALYKTAKDLPWVFPVSLFAFGAYMVLRVAANEAKKLSVRG